MNKSASVKSTFRIPSHVHVPFQQPVSLRDLDTVRNERYARGDKPSKRLPLTIFNNAMPSFPGLPTELLVSICEYLYHAHRPGLRALVLVNTSCHAVAIQLLVRSITFVLDHDFGVKRDLYPWRYRLQRTASFKYVHRLEIQGKTCQPDVAEDSAWDDLTTFVESLPLLSDLTWACSHQIPARLGKALQRRQPVCRLHVPTLNLRSLHSGEVDPRELELAVSSSLHSITVHYKRLNLEGYFDFNESAVLQLVDGGAPNLKEVRMFQPTKPFNVNTAIIVERPVRAWHGLPGNRKGALRRLEFAGEAILDYGRLRMWSRHTDFSAVRVLKFERRIEVEALEWLAYGSGSLALTTLTIYMMYEGQDKARLNDALQQLVRKLPSLKELELVGELQRSALAPIIQRAGPTLRKLSLSSNKPSPHRLVASQEDLELIVKNCPHLQDLDITISRSKGDANETALYRLMGSLPRLQSLCLALDTSDPSLSLWDRSQALFDASEDPTFDAFDREYSPLGTHYGIGSCKGHVRNVFMNSALDEPLAHAIFETVSAAKPPGALSLERSEINVTGGYNVDLDSLHCGITTVLKHMMRRYLIERNPRDDCRSQLIVTELDRHGREKAEAWGRLPLEGEVEAIFRRIWPAKGGVGGNWRDDWSSLPLVRV